MYSLSVISCYISTTNKRIALVNVFISAVAGMTDQLLLSQPNDTTLNLEEFKVCLSIFIWTCFCLSLTEM